MAIFPKIFLNFVYIYDNYFARLKVLNSELPDAIIILIILLWRKTTLKKRALSLLLVLSLRAGCLGVYTALVPPISAEVVETSEQDPDINVIFDRDYDDLDSVAYGASSYAPKGNTFEKMRENGDAFLRITAASTASESDGFIQLSLDDGSNGSKTLVLKMKIRVTPENAGFGRIAYIRHMKNDDASSNYTNPHLAYLTAGGVRNFASNGKVIYPCMPRCSLAT